MTKFQLNENGQVFATIEARSAAAAIRKYHRTRGHVIGSDSYDGWSGETSWYAHAVDQDAPSARADVRVTPRGTRLLSLALGA